MTRRRLVVLSSAATLVALGGLLLLAVVLTTRTEWGREQVRSRLVGFINSKIQGKMYIGRISGSLFTELVVDSFALREKNDSLFISTGRIRARFDPRDLLDRRIVIDSLAVEHPVINVREDSTKVWNFRRIFPPGPKKPPLTPTVRGFGDYIVVNEAVLRDITFLVTMPWQPDDTLRGAKRDSAIAFALKRTDKIIRRAGSHYVITRRWDEGQLQLAKSRVDDKEAGGRRFDIARLDVKEFDPPFEFRNTRGTVRLAGDSAWTEITHFELPGSSGSGGGKVWWGSNLPTRYDLTFNADTLSLADVAWVYPTLPTVGGGRTRLHMHNERDVRILDYVLSDMDVRTMNSRLRGTMTFATGAPIFAVKDIDVRAEPIDWRLIEHFSGEKLPYPWRGTIDATVRASGGPVNRFRIEDARFFFRDANVPGATARGRVSGMLDILEPAFTKFRGLALDLDHFDLRTMQFLNPTFPRISGLISGRATLDSVWTDLRFRNADITHRFGEHPPSRFTGSGRVTVGEKVLSYDLALDARPVNLTTVNLAYPEAEIPIRGSFVGPLRIQGQIDDLLIVTDLLGDPGGLAYDGRVDGDSVGGYGVHGTLRFRDLDARVLLDTSAVPHTSLTGTMVLDIVGDTITNYNGSLDLVLDRSTVDSNRVYAASRARVRFGDGRMRFDTLRLETDLVTLAGSGALGVVPGVRDSLHIDFSADSLGALRRYLVRAAGSDSAARQKAMTDSLVAVVTGHAVLFGSLDTLGVRTVLDGRDVAVGEYRGKVIRASANVEDVLGAAARGTVSVTADTLLFGALKVTSIGGDVALKDRNSGDFSVLTTMPNGPVLRGKGAYAISGDTSIVDVTELQFGLVDHEWKLARPSRVTLIGPSFSVDALRLTGSQGGSIALNGTAPTTGDVSIDLVADSVPLSDLAALTQTELTIQGVVSSTLEVRGTREEPIMRLGGDIAGAKVGQVSVARVSLAGQYADKRFVGSADVLRNDSAVVDVSANIPIDLALAARDTRLLDDTMRVAVRTRNLDMSIVESFTPSMTNSTGRLVADFALAGKPGATTLSGFLRIDTVATTLPNLGIRIRDFNADLLAERDTLRIRRFTMTSGDEPSDALSLTGLVALTGEERPSYDLSLNAREFHAIAKRRVADLSVSGDLKLKGSIEHAQLSGNVTINSGFIAIPEFSKKEVVSLDDPYLFNVVDTSLFANRSLLPKAPPAFIRNLEVPNVQIAMGPEVWLRSAEANINVGGAVGVVVARQRGSSAPTQLALEGSLQTVRGTYRLSLGPVQRTFVVEYGTLRFFGDADLNPVLDIKAIYTVRQISSGIGARNEVRVRARLLGTLAQPRIVLESADSLQLSESDLISYLVVGAPSFEIGGLGRSSYGLALGALGSVISSRLSGGLFDYVQIQTASAENSAFGASTGKLFSGAQFGVGKQLTERTFISLTAGLCSVGQLFGSSSEQLNPQDIAKSLGMTVEQILGRGFGFSASLEPSVSTLFCGANSNRDFISSRQQFGLDFFRAWRW